MTLHTLKSSALAALAVATLSASSATAALTYATDDLFLGFRQTGNNTTDYVVNIGQASQYRDAIASFPLSLTGLQADLLTAFGSLSNISWGVVGTTQNSPATAPDNFIRLIYTSEPIGSVPTATSSAGQSVPANSIIGMKNYWLTLTGSQGTVPNSAFGLPTDVQSWTTKVGGSFGSPGIMNTIEDSLPSNLDLFRVATTTSGQPTTNEGYFSFNAGVVTFNIPAVPVPEPSTVLFGIAMVVAMGLNRRRSTVA